MPLVVILLVLIIVGCTQIIEEKPVYPSVVREVGESVREVPNMSGEVVSHTPFEEVPSPETGGNVEKGNNLEKKKETLKLADEHRRWMEEMRKHHTANMELMQRLAMEARTRELSKEEKERKKIILNDADKLFKEGDYRKAMKEYAEALRIDPLDRDVLQKWLECYTLSGMRVNMPEIGRIQGKDEEKKEVPPELAKKVLLLEQKFAAAEQLFREGNLKEAEKKFNEVVEMIFWEKEKIDKKDYLSRAKNYIKLIEKREKGNKSNNEQ